MALLGRRLAAEAAGTAFLVATVIGSGIMAERLTQDVALQLLCNTLPTVGVLIVLIELLGPVSGAQLNPVVSLALAAMKQMSWRDVLACMPAQLAGGLVGMLLAHAMFDLPLLQVSAHVRTGAGQWLSEAVASFGLVALVLIASARGQRSLPALVGAYIGAAYWFTASTSFANPAVTIARALTSSFSGIRPLDVPMFVIAQIAGALLAVLAANWLLRKDNGPAPEREPID